MLMWSFALPHNNAQIHVQIELYILYKHSKPFIMSYTTHFGKMTMLAKLSLSSPVYLVGMLWLLCLDLDMYMNV